MVQISFEQNLESGLCHEGELVPLEEASGRVREDGVSDAVNEVQHSLFRLHRRLRSVNRLLKHHAKGLMRGTLTFRFTFCGLGF